MISIFFYSLATILVLFFLGYGITHFFLPKKLQLYALWLSPWFTIIFLVFILIILNLLGFTVRQASPIIIGSLLLLNIYVFLKTKGPRVNKEDVIIACFVLVSIFFNLMSLIKYEKFLTTVSLGNNDAVNYAASSDYIIDTLMYKNVALLRQNVLNANANVYDMFHNIYRWGPPIFAAFFQNLFHLQGYQYTYLSQVILYALHIPLVFILLKILYKPTLFSLFSILIFATFNVNLLYILYHNFFGHILFLGLYTFFLIFLFLYFGSNEPAKREVALYDIILGITLAVIYYSYYYGGIFVIGPLAVFVLLRFFLKKFTFDYWPALSKIFIITIITSSIPFFFGANETITRFLKNYTDKNAVIGWQAFRNNVPYPNPFEMMGFYSMHAFEPLPVILAILVSLLVVITILFGLLKSKNRLLLTSFLIVYVFLYYWTSLVQHNFFDYYRAVTYTLPFILVLFTIGLNEFFLIKKKSTTVIAIALISLVLFSAVKLNKRMNQEYVSVNQSFVSLTQLNIKDLGLLNEPMYTEYELIGEIPLWKALWTEYFLHPKKSQKKPQDNSLILLSKPAPRSNPPQILLKSPLIWENKYYVLGRLCNSRECLLDRPENLSGVTMGETTFEDSLLISGWSGKESTSRWSTGKESTLRLVTKEWYTQLAFQAYSLSEPQTISVSIDDTFAGTQPLTTNWSTYTFQIPGGISQGIHTVRFQYTHTYKPSEILKNQDARDLAVNFRWIRFIKT